jgi:hypothetical protein
MNSSNYTRAHDKYIFKLSNRYCNIFVFLYFVLFSGCSPISKSNYLSQFKAFVNDLSKKFKTYSGKEWENADEKYDKFINENSEKFKNDLTDENKVEKLIHYYKSM